MPGGLCYSFIPWGANNYITYHSGDFTPVVHIYEEFKVRVKSILNVDF